MEYKMWLFLCVLAVIFVFITCQRGCKEEIRVSINKDSESTQRYKFALLEDCYTYLTNQQTQINFDRHFFDWSYVEDCLKAKWMVGTDKYMITFYGTSTTVSDVNSFSEFIQVSNITDVSIFTATKNMSVLHTYTGKEDIKTLIDAVKRLEEKKTK